MERIALIGNNSIDYIKNLIDIWNDGNCAVLISENTPFEKVIEMMDEAKVEKCIVEYGVFSKWKIKPFYIDCFVSYNCKNKDPLEVPTYLYESFKEKYSDEEAVIIYSSGTTGKAKGIILSHYAINKNADSIIKYMNLVEKECIYIIKSFTHSSTLVGELLVSLKKKIRLVISESIIHPRYVLNNISKFNVTLICLNPTLLELLSEEYKKNKKIDLYSLKTIYSSGSILNDKIMKKAKEVFKNVKIYNVYGLSEAGPRVSAQIEHFNNLNSVGLPIDGVKIKILDDFGNEVDIGEKGVVHITTKSLFSGYVIGICKNKSLLDGWFNTGDIGFFDITGELYIIGRKDDMIIIDSHKIYSYDIESVIINNTMINNCIVSVATFNNKICLVCLYEGKKIDSTAIIKTIKPFLLPCEIPNIYFNYMKLPFNNNGKISRKKSIKIINSLMEQFYNEKRSL